MICRSIQAEGRFSISGLLLPFPITVWLIPQSTALIVIDTHESISMITVNRASWRINRDHVVIDTKAVTLRISIGKQPALQHFVG
ncbi:MAG: hypothetical protein DIKNOCCD_00685 [bacterium]|nr:hypothetical protein [bacterium]